MPTADLTDDETMIKEWTKEYMKEVNKVNDFYLGHVTEVMNRIEELKLQVKRVKVM